MMEYDFSNSELGKEFAELRRMMHIIETGLIARGFGPFDGSENSKGKCHTPDENHYILFTDEMILISTIPHWDQTEYCPGSFEYEWFQEEFSFDELDYIMKENSGREPN